MRRKSILVLTVLTAAFALLITGTVMMTGTVANAGNDTRLAQVDNSGHRALVANFGRDGATCSVSGGFTSAPGKMTILQNSAGNNSVHCEDATYGGTNPSSTLHFGVNCGPVYGTGPLNVSPSGQVSFTCNNN